MCLGHLAACSELSALWLPGELSRSKKDQTSTPVPSGRDLSSCSLRLVSRPRSRQCPLNSVCYIATQLWASLSQNSSSYPKMRVPPIICRDPDSASKFYTPTKQLLCTKHCWLLWAEKSPCCHRTSVSVLLEVPCLYSNHHSNTSELDLCLRPPQPIQ